MRESFFVFVFGLHSFYSDFELKFHFNRFNVQILSFFWFFGLIYRNLEFLPIANLNVFHVVGL